MNNSIISEIKYFFSKGAALNKFLMINIGVFILIKLIRLPYFLSGSEPVLYNQITHWLSVPSSLSMLILQPWSLITYMFLHEGFFHLLFNMITLFWTGRIFTEFLGDNRFISTYFLGGIAGALLFTLAYNIFPVFSRVNEFSFLMGASAAVMAILVAIAVYLPDYTVFLIIIGPVRLKYIALFLVILDFLSIESDNPGGRIAHIGGTIYGFAFAWQLKKGTNIALFFDKFVDWVTGLFKRKSKLKVAYKNKNNVDEHINADAKAKQKKIDEILDKISRSGYDSLTKDEKDILFKISKNI